MRTANISHVCPVLVGRSTQLQLLRRVLQQAHDSKNLKLIVSITGEAGIGKSRLIAEAKDAALRSGFLILQGRCFEPDRGLPYAPIVDLLREYCASHSDEEVRRAFENSASRLNRIFPLLLQYFPDEKSPSPVPPDQEKHSLFDSLAQFISEFSQPLLIIMEDLHWSDEASLELLLHVSRRTLPRSTILVITSRPDEVQADLSQCLEALHREQRDLVEISLTHLNISEVDMMIQTILGSARPNPPEFLETIFNLTEGNPFFVEEILKSFITSTEIPGLSDRSTLLSVESVRIPHSIQLAVQQRVNRLSPAARNVITLAAIAGRRFDFSLLQMLTGQAEIGLLQLIKELVQAQLVVEESSETFAFRHALTREAIYTQVLSRERKIWHRAIADAMEKLYSSEDQSHAADLAEHFYSAGSWIKAMEYSSRAGRRAQDLYAPRAAVTHFTRAMTAAANVLQEVSPDLYRARGQAYEIIGEFESAIADHQAALQLARATANQEVEWQSLVDLGMVWTSREYAKAGEYFQKALDIARSLDQPGILAYSLNRMANWLTNLDRPSEGILLHKEALAIFEKANDQPGMAVTLDALGTTYASLVNIEQATLHYRRAANLFRVVSDRLGLASALTMLTLCGIQYLSSVSKWAGQSVEDCLRDGEEALAITQAIGWRSGQALSLINLGFAASMPGDYGKALKCAEAGLQIALEIEHYHWQTLAHILLGAIYLDLLSLSSARQHLEEALTLASQTGSDYWYFTTLGFLIPTCIQQGDLQRAESALTSLAPSTPMQTVGQRQAWYAAAELCLTQGNAQRALEFTEQLLATAAGVSQHGWHALPRLAKLRGEILLQLGENEAGLESLNSGLQSALDQRAQSLIWRFHVALGRIYHQARKFNQADEHWQAARMLIQQLANTLQDKQLQEVFIQRTAELIPPLTADRMAKQASGGLTKREYQVATLIAEGKSNREISDQLVLSERTVEKHVESILTKLSFNARAQIAVWVSRRQISGKSM